MRKFVTLCVLVLLVVGGCANDKAKKKETVKQEFATKEESPESIAARTPAKTKMELTEEKLNEVRSLKEKLKQKKELMDKKAAKFSDDITSNVEEIKAERAKRGLKEFKQAITSEIIEQCLLAMQKAKAYKEYSEREAEKTWLAVIAVTGKEKQISLDKTLLEDMDEEQIAELITQLDKVINEIGPQAEDFKITDENTTREPLEKLYEEYIRKDEREKEQRELNQKKQEEQRQKEAAEATRRRAEEDARRLEEENKRVAQIRLAEEQKKKIEEAQRLEEERRVNEKKAIELKLAEQRRLEQKRQDAAAEAAEQAKREAEEKKRLAEEAAERAKEERARQQAEKEIANVKILSPTSEMYIHGMGWDQWKNRIVWSHRESVVAFLMARKVIIKELTQDATSEIELEDQLDFVDMAWSADDKKIAVISANHCPRRYKNNEPYDGGKASIAIWSMSQNKFEQSADIPCEMGINIVGWRGNNVLIHNSGVYTTMFTEHNKPLPVHLYDSESKTLSHPVDAYAVAWRDDNSFFFGQEHTIKLYNIATRTVTTTLEECPENGDATLFYQLCPNSLKVLRLYYSNGWLVAYTAAGDDDKRFSIWSTTAQAKQDWVKGADPDACWARGDNLIYLLLGDALYEVSPLKKNILRLSLAKDLLDDYDQPSWSPAKPHLFLDRETEFSSLDSKIASAKDRFFIKSLKTDGTVAALKCDVDMAQPLIAWSPSGRYVVLCNNHFARAWDVSSVN